MTDFHPNKITLNKLETKWILEQRLSRITDNKEVLIYPMGAERYLRTLLQNESVNRYPISNDVKNKNIIIIPGYANNCFLFAQAGAKSIHVYDKDPLTIAWMKTFKKYYHYREYNNNKQPYPSIGELLTALTHWYPPLLKLPAGSVINKLRWVCYPKSLRRTYIFYMLHLARQAVEKKLNNDYEYEKNIHFYTGELKALCQNNNRPVFDTAFVPYLLGVTNGIENKKDLVQFIRQITQLVPEGNVLVSPSQNTKEFFNLGNSYFVTTEYPDIASIPGLSHLLIDEDKAWYRGQGLAVFSHSGHKASRV